MTWPVFKTHRNGKFIEPDNYFQRRTDLFKDWLKTQEASTIAVFAHRDFLHEFTGKWKETEEGKVFEGVSLLNCGVHVVNL